MGVTQYEIKLLENIIQEYKPQNVIEMGSQTNYTTKETDKPPFMSEWFNEMGIFYKCIDMAGDNGAYLYDLSQPISVGRQYDLVTDFGTSEHCVQMNEYETVSFHDGHINSIYPKGEIKSIEEGYYNCWINKHNLLKVGGVMINVNPLTGHWYEHGYSYLGEAFYNELVKLSGYELLKTEVICASGNCESGKNVVGVLRKVSEQFPDFKEFYKNLPIYKL
jgi:hypothetical protein